MIETIIVGVDGSDNAKLAVAWAAEVAASMGARVVAVHAAGLLEHERGDPAGAHLLPSVQTWTSGLDVLPAGRVERRVVPGDPVSVLAQVAADEAADLVVVGTRGEGAGMSLGSTSRQLAERSAGPLVIVPGAVWPA